jgi:hypothetical protein
VTIILVAASPDRSAILVLAVTAYPGYSMRDFGNGLLNYRDVEELFAEARPCTRPNESHEDSRAARRLSRRANRFCAGKGDDFGRRGDYARCQAVCGNPAQAAKH